MKNLDILIKIQVNIMRIILSLDGKDYSKCDEISTISNDELLAVIYI